MLNNIDIPNVITCIGLSNLVFNKLNIESLNGDNPRNTDADAYNISKAPTMTYIHAS